MMFQFITDDTHRKMHQIINIIITPHQNLININMSNILSIPIISVIIKSLFFVIIISRRTPIFALSPAILY